MKKAISIIASFLALLLVLAGMAYYSFNTSKSEIEKALDLNLSSATEKSYVDNHGGFMGDGVSVGIIDCESTNVKKQITNAKHWKKLPAVEEFNSLVFGKASDSSYESPMIADEDGYAYIPTVKNGYYYFKDRNSDARDIYNISAACKRASFNFDIAVYDCDTNTLYFLSLDT
ncbi:hypothetical protein SAMN05216249_10813 [Acetitomaculum ruminis DSM 5522]|uniref:Uncharacterized protein n=1 Tax=Acetitomaculum ruminis DSM 5522 TaxID=1120918 RepID=A0A1I0XX48_9FIRM|nr:hypothetical protein [Acetitomaculum ruminis]SFB05729.1 hypothetical protein SAMN05216249_10813 [Acetitomaculum ruminis DSM 5522]